MSFQNLNVFATAFMGAVETLHDDNTATTWAQAIDTAWTNVPSSSPQETCIITISVAYHREFPSSNQSEWPATAVNIVNAIKQGNINPIVENWPSWRPIPPNQALT